MGAGDGHRGGRGDREGEMDTEEEEEGEGLVAGCQGAGGGA